MSLRPPTIPEIRAVVTDYFDLDDRDVFNGSHRPLVMRARWVTWWLCRELRRMSNVEIGRTFFFNNHTVGSGLSALEKDPLLKQQAEEIRTSLSNGRST